MQNIRTLALAATAGCLALSACGDPTPKIIVSDWTLKRTREGYQLQVLADWVRPAKYGAGGNIQLFYSNGCSDVLHLNTFKPDKGPEQAGAQDPLPMQPLSKPSAGPAKFTQTFYVTKETVAGARLYLFHVPGIAPEDETPAFLDQGKVIDPAAQAQAEKTKCGERQARDPAPTRDTAATLINLRGFLCGQVTDIYPRGRNTVVHCTLYRDGRGKATYLVHTDSAAVERLD